VLLGAAAGGAIGVPFGSSVAAAADGANLDANAVPPPEGAAATTYPCPSADAIVEVLGVEMTLEAHDETMLSGTVCDYEAAECDFCLPFVSLVYQPAGLVGEFGEGEEQDGVGDRAVWGTFGDILWVWVGENFVSVWVDLEGDEGARDEVLAIADVAIEPLDGFEAPEFEAPVAAEVALDSCPEPGLIGEAVGIELELEEFPGDGILSCGYTGETADEVFDVVVQFLPFVSFEDLLAEDPSYAGDVDAGLVEEISGLGDHAIWDATVECEEALGVWSDELFMQVTVFDDCAALDDAIAVAEAVLG
jgi:hypothetical protein